METANTRSNKLSTGNCYLPDFHRLEVLKKIYFFKAFFVCFLGVLGVFCLFFWGCFRAFGGDFPQFYLKIFVDGGCDVEVFVNCETFDSGVVDSEDVLDCMRVES